MSKDLNFQDIDKFYTLWSLPQFLISVILACPESFLRSRTVGRILAPASRGGDPTSGNDTENKYSISDALQSLPQGSSHRLGFRIQYLEFSSKYYIIPCGKMPYKNLLLSQHTHHKCFLYLSL